MFSIGSLKIEGISPDLYEVEQRSNKRVFRYPVEILLVVIGLVVISPFSALFSRNEPDFSTSACRQDDYISF